MFRQRLACQREEMPGRRHPEAYEAAAVRPDSDLHPLSLLAYARLPSGWPRFTRPLAPRPEDRAMCLLA